MDRHAKEICKSKRRPYCNVGVPGGDSALVKCRYNVEYHFDLQFFVVVNS